MVNGKKKGTSTRHVLCAQGHPHRTGGQLSLKKSNNQNIIQHVSVVCNKSKRFATIKFIIEMKQKLRFILFYFIFFYFVLFYFHLI